jgi:hypothetical protein
MLRNACVIKLLEKPDSRGYCFPRLGQPVTEVDFKYYILVDRKPVEATLLEWGAWFENFENRRVARTDIDALHVSTVFLGIDHNWSDVGPPLLFETMVFDEPHEKELFGRLRMICEEIDIERTPTWDEAMRAHERACRKLQDLLRSSEEIAGGILASRARKERAL